MSDQVPCPSCEATGELLASGIIYADGHSGPYCKMMPCPDCKGKKTIPINMLEWQDRGKEIRRWRRSERLTLRDVSIATGLLPSEVSAMECGTVDNSSWKSVLLGPYSEAEAEDQAGIPFPVAPDWPSRRISDRTED